MSYPQMLLHNTKPEVHGRSNRLVVLLHAWMSSSAKLADVKAAITEALPDADLLLPEYPGTLFSMADSVEITEAIIESIADAVKNRSSKEGIYEDIVLIGHSLGALLVRKAYVFAKGQNQDHSGYLPPVSQPWGDLVSRIILLAGTNRGWELRRKAKALSWLKWCGFVAGATLWRWFRLSRLINSAREGAPFVANLRIQWINLLRDASASRSFPLTVQLLGKIDDIVDEQDNVDVQCGANFVYKSVPETGHVNAIDFSGEIGKRRKEIFLNALLTRKEDLRSDTTVVFKEDPNVDHVVFIMHGIRDYGHWTSNLGQSVLKEAARRGQKVEVITSDYGYFPMLGFLLQPERQQNVRWFMDQYTEALARYPKATFSFIGHSNGTYLLASALDRYEACAFDRVVFAGSVVNRNYPWDKESKDRARISSIQNYVATADWVVAIFPALFERLRGARADLGSAGHTGFAASAAQGNQVCYIKGGHGAAIVPDNFGALASFVLGDDTAAPPEGLKAGSQSETVVWAGKFCVMVWLFLLALALAPIAVPLILWLVGSWPQDWWPWWAFGVIWLPVLYALFRWV